jgi:hypothetical protein
MVILASLSAKLAGYRWLQSESRQRQQYWYRGYVIQSQFNGRPPMVLDFLLAEEYSDLLKSGRTVDSSSLNRLSNVSLSMRRAIPQSRLSRQTWVMKS